MISAKNRVLKGAALGAIMIAAILSFLAGAVEPVMQMRLGSGEKSLERYKQYGYTGAILGDATQLASYDAVCPNAIPVGSELRKRIERRRKTFQKDYDRANALGLAVCVMTDEVSLPTPVLERLRHSDDAAGIDFDNPQFWNLYRAKYAEVLRAYPRIACVVVRTGENYSRPGEGFIGRTVFDGGYDDAYIRHMQQLIEETRQVVVDEFGRRLIWRTWDLGNDGFHANPKVYDRVLAGVADRGGLMLAIKHTQTDFWLYNDFNPTIGRGGVDTIVEFQCAREYEGKGAFPDYLGPMHAEDIRKAAARGAKGVWIWDFGGGWGGPFLESDRWVRLNIETTSRLAVNPELSARALAEEWAAKEFGDKAARNVAQMLLLSGECIRKSMYIEAFARSHTGWKPSLNLLRDDIIRGAALKQLYEGSKGALPEVFQEKEQGVALAARMRSLFEISRADIVAARGERVFLESLGSLVYLEDLSEVLCHYVNGMFSFYRWQETGDPTSAEKVKTELEAWRAAWDQYQTEVPKLAGAASLYRSRNTQSADSAGGAMADLCENALRELAAGGGRPAKPSPPNSVMDPPRRGN
jgi:hypothetical protein